MMAPSIALAMADKALADSYRERLIAVGVPEDRIAPEPLRCHEDVLEWLGAGQAELLVLHEEIAARGAPPDRTGDVALEILNQRQDFGRRTPTLVITNSRNPLSDLQEYCTPANDAIALPSVNLKPQHAAILKGFLGMIGPQRQATWTVLEIEVRHLYCKCLLGDENGRLFPWGENKGMSSIKPMAMHFDKPEAFERGWISMYDQAGRQLFDTHVVGVLGRGLFAHIERAAGGLNNLAFRFKVDDPNLYSVPFEASVRAIDEDPDKSHFVRLYAPVARWLPQTGTMRTSAGSSGRLPPELKVLAIRSQVGEHPDGATKTDLLDIGGGKTLTFRKLYSIDDELRIIDTLARGAGNGRIALRLLDLSKECEPGAAAALLEETCAAHDFDIIHFAGHSWSSSTGAAAQTVLVLPGATKGNALPLPIERFARIAGQAKARLVYLSSCQGSSARSVLSLVQHGVQQAVGFRCNVDDAKATRFAADFYTALFKPSPIPAAFQTSCSKAREALSDDGEDPIWASPMLVAQSTDWAARF